MRSWNPKIWGSHPRRLKVFSLPNSFCSSIHCRKTKPRFLRWPIRTQATIIRCQLELKVFKRERKREHPISCDWFELSRWFVGSALRVYETNTKGKRSELTQSGVNSILSEILSYLPEKRYKNSNNGNSSWWAVFANGACWEMNMYICALK